MDFSLNDTQLLQWESIVDFSRRELNAEVRNDDLQGTFPLPKWRKCAEMGLLGLLTPEEYGGLGQDLTSAAISLQALSYGCEDSGLTHAVVTQLCCVVLLNQYGSAEQKARFLPKLSSGELIAAQSITEPDAGSDVLSMRTKADASSSAYLLTGGKVFISNGPLADLVIVFAKDSEGKSSFGGDISCFLLEKGTPGFSAGKPLAKMGLRTLQNSELFFDEVAVAQEAMLGKRGHGMFIFGEAIEWERVLMTAAHLGTIQRVLEKCVSYAKTRKQFGKEIGQNQSVANKIGAMKVNLELGKLMLYKMAWLKDQGKRATLEASIGKLFVSESLKSACLDAVQIHGGYGFMQECELERDLRDSIAATIYSGTSEIQQNIIARMLGL
ncbi:acyl-CoA dehydrogenase family protein [Geomonas sp.]|uniref:acyl-CoA dehydrogenase family protein n=1 Tax=Geomonas sp. TaxID=2651584 RepID=UPI002B4A0292|nr:acyl-CoA dehydrogenase family protein [Geomonas sp.]HJV34266.1 acyl-CoA dehydrogenase family protein [Geomonas sp.]